MADSAAVPSTLDEFLASVERRAFRMAEFATGNRDDALELVQDAMLKLVDRYDNRSPEEWPPLFYRILQNRIQDWYRRRSVRRRLISWLPGRPDADDDPVQALPDPRGDDPGKQVGRERAMEALDAALRALPVRQQQAFLLRIWEGMDVAATAYAMGCSEGSVKTHLSRAMEKLRLELGDHWP